MKKVLFRSVLVSVLPAVSVFAAQEKPNFLILMSDDLTYTDLGFQGNKDVRTPNLDKLAKESMRFRYCYNSSPMCAPTRMSLYTGIDPVRNGGYPNHSRVYDNVKSIAHHLGGLGYDVAQIGKRHENPRQNFPVKYISGRDHDDGKGLDLDTNDAAKFFNEDKDKSWCLIVTSNQPHSPWNRGDSSKYDPKKFALPPYMVDTDVTRKQMAKYYAEIEYMDSQMGRVLKALEESGQKDNTFVIFLSEQGSQYPHCKWTCYDTGLHSAAIVRWPAAVKPDTETSAMIKYIDVLPTMIEAAGGNTSDYGFDGKSFLSVLKGETKSHRDYVFGLQTTNGVHFGNKGGYGIRTVMDSKYRLIWNLNYENKFGNIVTHQSPIYSSWKAKSESGDAFAKEQYDKYLERPEFELYNIQNDPYEMKDLSADPQYAEVIKNLKTQLDGWMAQQGDKGRETEAAAFSRLNKNN